eukprot:TRINITY_DN5963_c0_g1_i2.p1 TRINITY_DN5963_c0_g1~~TRINITY_DN5963_c0_g1_i2.p1  ORF type:complete len:120 (-),score=16.43 TRINITY_DN5963_c0_g1_i2:94-453(-)
MCIRDSLIGSYITGKYMSRTQDQDNNYSSAAQKDRFVNQVAQVRPRLYEPQERGSSYQKRESYQTVAGNVPETKDKFQLTSSGRYQSNEFNDVRDNKTADNEKGLKDHLKFLSSRKYKF